MQGMRLIQKHRTRLLISIYLSNYHIILVRDMFP